MSEEEGSGERSAGMYVTSAGVDTAEEGAYTWRVSASFFSASFFVAFS